MRAGEPVGHRGPARHAGDVDPAAIEGEREHEVVDHPGEKAHVVSRARIKSNVPLVEQALRVDDEEAVAIGERVPVIAKLDPSGIAVRAVQHDHQRRRRTRAR
jgi:hypothetical protein